MGRFQHHDLLPLDMKKSNYCRIHHLWIRQSVLNVHNIIVMAVTKTYLHCFITTLRWLLHSDALHQASACWGIVTPYCDICMGQNWLNKLFGRVILTNADLLSKSLSSLHLRAKVLTKLIHIICSKITIYELLSFSLGPMSQQLWWIKYFLYDSAWVLQHNVKVLVLQLHYCVTNSDEKKCILEEQNKINKNLFCRLATLSGN